MTDLIDPEAARAAGAAAGDARDGVRRADAPDEAPARPDQTEAGR